MMGAQPPTNLPVKLNSDNTDISDSESDLERGDVHSTENETEISDEEEATTICSPKAKQA